MSLNLSLLVDLYGDIPSFRNASTVAITMHPEELTVTLYLEEPPAPNMWHQDWDECLHCLACIRWTELKECKIVLGDGVLDKLVFEMDNGLLCTHMVGVGLSSESLITSRYVFVESVSMPTARHTDEKGEALENVAVMIRSR